MKTQNNTVSQKERKQSQSRSEYLTNKIMLSFALAVVGEILLIWMETAAIQISTLIIFDAMAPWVTLAGVPLMLLSVWKMVRDSRKTPNPYRYFTGTYLFFLSLMVSVTGFLMWYDVRVAIRVLYVLYPCVAGLYLIYSLYQRGFFYISVFLLTAGTGLYMLNKLNTVRLHSMGILGAVLAAAAAVLVFLLQHQEGRLILGHKSVRVLPDGTEYGALYITTLLTAVVFVAAVVLTKLFTAALVPYLLYLLLAYLLVMLVYYTIKLM